MIYVERVLALFLAQIDPCMALDWTHAFEGEVKLDRQLGIDRARQGSNPLRCHPNHRYTRIPIAVSVPLGQLILFFARYLSIAASARVLSIVDSSRLIHSIDLRRLTFSM